MLFWKTKNRLPALLFVLLLAIVVPVAFWYLAKSNTQVEEILPTPSVLSSDQRDEKDVSHEIVKEDLEELPEKNTEEKVKAKTSYSRTQPVKFGVVVNDHTNRDGELQHLEEILGTNINTVSIYKQFGNADNNHLTQTELSYIKQKGKRLIIAWEPLEPNDGVNQSADYLIKIINGELDAYIRSFANEIKQFGNPVIIRFAHEMNGDWYPWGNRPVEFVKAYRHVVNVVRAEGVPNVYWMWNINGNSVPYEPISQSAKYYPGDSYVDYIGIDAFNFGTTQSWASWLSFGQLFLPAYQFVTANYNKPVIIPEFASTENGGDKSKWVREMFDELDSNFRLVEEIVWFNIVKETDWRVNSSDASVNAFKENL